MQVAQAEQVKNESQFNYNKRVFALQHAMSTCSKLQGVQDAATSNMVTEGQMKLSAMAQNGLLDRKQLMAALVVKSNKFAFNQQMAEQFDMLLQDEHYGKARVSLQSVLVNYILISQLPINMKLHQMLCVLAPSEDDQYSVRKATDTLIRLEHHLDNRIQQLARDPSLSELVRSKANSDSNSLSKMEMVELITNSTNFFAVQQLLLAVEQDYQKVASPEEFAEIYNRPSPNQSFNMNGDASNSENNSFILPNEGNESFKDKADDRKCQCTIF